MKMYPSLLSFPRRRESILYIRQFNECFLPPVIVPKNGRINSLNFGQFHCVNCAIWGKC